MFNGSGPKFNWRIAIFVILALLVVIMIAGRMINGVTYPVVSAEALLPSEATVLLSTTFSDTDQGLLALIRDLRAVEDAKEGKGAKARNFLANLSGAMDIEQSLPIVQSTGFWFGGEDGRKVSFLSARSMSHSVVFTRWSFGCQPPPQGFQKMKYQGEKMLVQVADGESAVLAMSGNNFILGNDQDAAKRLVDKLKSGKEGLDVSGELGAAYEQYSRLYPFVAAVDNKGRELATFIERVAAPNFPDTEKIKDIPAFIEDYVGQKLQQYKMVAVGGKIASADRFEASGFVVCADEQTATALADVMNAKLQKPAKDGEWSASVRAKAEGTRVTVDVEINGLKELLLAQMEKAEQAAKEAAAEATASGSAAETGSAVPDVPPESPDAAVKDVQ